MTSKISTMFFHVGLKTRVFVPLPEGQVLSRYQNQSSGHSYPWNLSPAIHWSLFIKRASLALQGAGIQRARMNSRYVHPFLPGPMCATRTLPQIPFPVDRFLTLLWTLDHLSAVPELNIAPQWYFNHHCIPYLLCDSQEPWEVLLLFPRLHRED